MQETGFVDRRERVAQCDADGDHRGGRQRTGGAQLLLQRPTVHEFHPQSNAAVYALSTVNHHDVLVAHLCEQSAFIDHFRGNASIELTIGPEQLESDDTVEAAIVRAIHVAEGASTDAVEDGERPPDLWSVCARGATTARSKGDGRANDGLEESKTPKRSAARSIDDLGFDRVPIDGREVRDGDRDVSQPVRIHHL